MLRLALLLLSVPACTGASDDPSDEAIDDEDDNDRPDPDDDTDTVAPPDFTVERPGNPTCQALPRAQAAASIRFTEVFPDLYVDDFILALTQSPTDTDHWYLATLGGEVLRVGSTGETTALNLEDRVVVEGEGGLLGLAFSPTFADDGLLYVSYTTAERSRVSRFSSSDGGLTFSAGSEVVLLEHDLGYGNHNGGDLHFDTTGMLVFSLGDGGDFNNAREMSNLWGTLVRIDPLSSADLDPLGPIRVRNYAIPDDNPTIAGAPPEVYAHGFRNPFRFGIDPLAGDMWVGDVGEDQWEEVSRVVPGGHHGWPEKEGFRCFLAEEPCDNPEWIDPMVVYGRDEGVSVIGGRVYRGDDIAGLQGVFLFSEWLSGDVWGVFTNELTGEPERRYLGTMPSGVAWGQDQDGEVYAASGGTILKVDADDAPEVTFPQKLSETGCVQADNPREMAPGLIPYTVAMPLWSDAATKRRWFALPDETHIAAEEGGHWSLPVGSVVVKEFTANQQRVETRLMMRHDDGGWGFYTYRWDEDGEDATLVLAGSTVDADGETWSIPSRSQCLQCHTEVSGITLGLETPQLNREANLWGVGRANQIEVFRRMGVLEDDPGEPATLDAHPALDDGGASRRSTRASLPRCAVRELPPAGRARPQRPRSPVDDSVGRDAGLRGGPDSGRPRHCRRTHPGPRRPRPFRALGADGGSRGGPDAADRQRRRRQRGIGRGRGVDSVARRLRLRRGLRCRRLELGALLPRD